jgi:hypothetical protein
MVSIIISWPLNYDLVLKIQINADAEMKMVEVNKALCYLPICGKKKKMRR